MGSMTTLAARMAALADELQPAKVRDAYTDGLAHAAARIREELATAGPQSVWVVAHDDYEDQLIEAVFTTADIAEQHRDQLKAERGSCDVNEYDVRDRLPQRLQLVALKAIVHPDGMVEVVPSNAGKRHATWDYETWGSSNCYRAPDGRTHVDVCDVAPEPLLRAMVEEVIAGLAAEQAWTEPKLEWALARKWVTHRPQVVEQHCYRIYP